MNRRFFTMGSCISTALFILSVFITSANGQYKEWRPVSPEEISTTVPTVEPDADAEALFWEMRIDDSSSDDLDMWHYVRVKIFTERGRERYSKFDIPFAKGTKIKDLAARVIKPDGSIIEVAEKDVFEREIVRAGGLKIKAKSFAVPNIEPGVIVEYKYKEAVDDAGASGMRLPLQRDLPIRHLAYYYKPYQSKEPQYTAYNTNDFKFVKEAKGFFLGERRNVESFKEEPRMPPEDTVRPWVMLTSTRIAITDMSYGSLSFVIKDPSNPRAYWAGVAREKMSALAFILKPDKKIKAAAEQITVGASTTEDKLSRLYEFCQSQIDNVWYDPSVTPEQRKKLPPVRKMADILERKQASTPGYVDWLFAAMAGSLGMDVRLVFTGNRSKMFFDPTMTNERFIHPAGVAVQIGSDHKYFSPGNPFLPAGALSWYEEGSSALLLGENTYIWTESPQLSHEDNNHKRTAKFQLNEDGTLEGDIVIEMTGQPALAYRQTYWDENSDKQADSIIESVKSRISAAETTAVSVENVRDPKKPLIQRFKIKVPNYAQKTGKRLFLQPSFFEYGPSALFSSNARKFDVFFRYPWSETDSITIKLPVGFDLDNAESPAPFSDTGRIGSLDYNIKYDRQNRELIVDRKFYFGAKGTIFFKVGSYEALKNVFDVFHKTDAHTISLKQN